MAVGDHGISGSMRYDDYIRVESPVAKRGR